MSSSSLCRFVGGFGIRKPFLLTTASSLLSSLSNQRRPECFSLFFFSILICTPTPFSRPRLSLVYPTPTSKCLSLSILWHYITRVYATVSLGFLISSFFLLNFFHSNRLASFSLIFVRIIISVGFPWDRLSCGCRCYSTMTQALQPWPDNQLTPEAKL